MSTRAVVRWKDWTVQPDNEPDAKPHTYAQECDVCGEGSARSIAQEAGTLWILEHVKANPSHSSYTQIVKRGFRAWMR
ncbi:hypothetical protein QZH56_28870 [Streptomyces olivoreticuli]|uniref:DUF7848 domain-containing protein n=1 Tax=Streptomyces olivoreticuli TaxID=68246 RepID=UPI002659DD9C|nr:hypothetical protein [Streptomyces olivoreticuli]WKK22737.1 hypothetical protein QZH56_28870 [Streptomyces olivoreticuli]